MAAIDRRRFIGTGLAALGAGALPLPAWAAGRGMTPARRGFGTLSGDSIDLAISRTAFSTGGRHGHTVTVNGMLPGPLVRLREGQHVRLNVTNQLDVDSSIHWHGLLVPFQFDGVPGISFPGIRPGETFTYRFPIRQSGTYWWHSHSGLQEQIGHYGPIVIDPAEPAGPAYDREFVLLLSEFTPMHPHTIMRKLKLGEHYFNYQMNSATSGDMALARRLAWGRMRMNPHDISDVSGAEYTYLVNGHGPADDLELLFEPGERVRLRIINGSAMTFFNIRIPGTEMLVVQADGQDVQPVPVDEFQIGVAETYDVIVQPREGAHVFVAEAMDRSGMGVANLTSRPGARIAPPPLRKPPVLTMADMGMGGMDHGATDMGAMDMGGKPAAGMDGTGMDGAGMDHSAMGHGSSAGTSMGGMDHSMRDTSRLPASVATGPGVDMVSPMPVDRMDFPGLGLDHVGHRVLRYTQLVSARPHAPRTPSREMEIHLTGNMERYMWSFDGKKLNAVSDHPIRFAYDERVRVKLVNDTMMAHPIHLHGHFFELVNGAPGNAQPKKHTVIVQPGGIATFDLTADEPGDWAFHCHLLYHMHAGMFQIVTVAQPGEGAA